VPERNAGRILVVDDEQSLLIVMEQYLRRLGNDVVACRDGQQAWEEFERDPSSFTLVLADMTLPEMSGSELLSRMLSLNPDIGILICSGYPFDSNVIPASHQHQIGFLQKPFTPRMLAESIEQLKADMRRREAEGF
jgi:two-component system, cell cycle sensor histidine kinase and response regulator CckA